MTREYEQQGQATHRYNADQRREFNDDRRYNDDQNRDFNDDRRRRYNGDDRRTTQDGGMSIFLYNYFFRYFVQT